MKKPQPREQIASIKYLDWQDQYRYEKPYQVFAEVPEGSDENLSNLVFANSPPIHVQDLRGNEKDFSLDKNGFEIRNLKMPDFGMKTQQDMRENVIPHFDAFVKREIEGADFIHCFDWGFRGNGPKDPQVTANKMNVNDKMYILNPGRQVHCDQSPAGAVNRLSTHAPELMEPAMRGRFRIINLWIPLHHVVQDNTLAVCDGSTIKSEDLVEADHISRTYLGNTMYGLYSPEHKWYYLHHQTPEEVILFKIFDSATDVQARCSLHVAIDYNEIPSDCLPRESFEIRYLVVSKPQDEG